MNKMYGGPGRIRTDVCLRRRLTRPFQSTAMGLGHIMWVFDRLPTKPLHKTALIGAVTFGAVDETRTRKKHSAWKADALPIELLPQISPTKQ